MELREFAGEQQRMQQNRYNQDLDFQFKIE